MPVSPVHDCIVSPIDMDRETLVKFCCGGSIVSITLSACAAKIGGLHFLSPTVVYLADGIHNHCSPRATRPLYRWIRSVSYNAFVAR